MLLRIKVNLTAPAWHDRSSSCRHVSMVSWQCDTFPDGVNKPKVLILPRIFSGVLGVGS